MKIHGNRPPEGQEVNLGIQKVSKPDVKEKANAPQEKTRTGDRVEISGMGKEVAELMAAVNQLPDIRSEKVNAIKEAIESGKYRTDALKIAEKMLEEI